MEKLLTSSDFKKLIDANAMRLTETPKLKTLIMQTEEKSALVITKEFAKPAYCTEDQDAVKPDFKDWRHEVSAVDVEIALHVEYYQFRFSAKIQFRGKSGAPGAMVPMHWKSVVSEIKFDDAKRKVSFKDIGHWPSIYFKDKESFEYTKKLIEEITLETKEIIDALHKG